MKDDTLRRMVEAFSVIESITRAPRPKAYGNNMPDVPRFATEGDVWAAEMDSILEDGGETFRRHQWDRIRQLERLSKSHWTAKQISQAEEAMVWPAYVTSPIRREMLVLKIRCEAKSGMWAKALRERNRRLPAKQGISRTYSYRLISEALQDVETKIRKDATLLRSADRMLR